MSTSLENSEENSENSSTKKLSDGKAMIMANDDEKGRIAADPSVGAVPAASSSSSPSSPKLIDAEENEKEAARLLNPSSLKVPKGRLTGCLAFSVFVVTLASFQFGYHIGCVNAPQALITKWLIESHKELFGTVLDKETADFVWSVAVAVFPAGGMIGALASGWLADKAGRRGALFYNNLFAFAAAALLSLAKSAGAYPMIILGRFIIGINCGLSTGLVPMYLTEVSPINLRGMIGSVHQLMVTVAILVSQVFGLEQLLGTEDRWAFIFGFTAVPAALQVLTLWLCPESPKYSLAVKGDEDRAEKDLKKLRGSDDVVAELAQMKDEVAVAAAQEKPSMVSMFKKPLLWPMIIAIMMMLSQQLSGINVAMFYSNAVFMGAGLSAVEATYATIGMGSVNVLMTIVSIWLVDHPKFGRRSLHLGGMIGMWVSTIFLVVILTVKEQTNAAWSSYTAIGLVLLFVICFAVGPGPIPWFFVSEIFSSSARGNAGSIACMVNWTANLLVGLLFLPLNNWIHQFSFLVFTGFLSFFIFFTWRYVPETKGKTVEEITAGFEKR